MAQQAPISHAQVAEDSEDDFEPVCVSVTGRSAPHVLLGSSDEEDSSSSCGDVECSIEHVTVSDSDGDDTANLPATRTDHSRAPVAGKDEREAAVLRLSEGPCSLSLPAALHGKLFLHQVEAVKWMFSLVASGSGGVLGDDMGLGKTLSVCALLSGMFRAKAIKRAMVVCPKSLLDHWHAELCGAGVEHVAVFAGTARQREALVSRARSSPTVLLITYGMLAHNRDLLARESGVRWCVQVLDEGHLLKNTRTQQYKAVSGVAAGARFLLTGTPMQNNVLELHALFDLACPGALGTRTAFHETASLIEASQERCHDVGAESGHRGRQAAASLQLQVAPFFLRREKASTAMVTVADSDGPHAGGGGGGAAGCRVPSKVDVAVWLTLHPLQLCAYRAFLLSDAAKEALAAAQGVRTGKSALAAISMLKKICDSPALLSANAKAMLRGEHASGPEQCSPESAQSGGEGGAAGISCSANAAEDSDNESSNSCGTRSSSEASDGDGEDDEDGDDEGSKECGRRRRGRVGDAAGRLLREQEEALALTFDGGADDGRRMQAQLARVCANVRSRRSAADSCKTVFVLALLRDLAAAGERTLVFSSSKVMLNILQASLVRTALPFLRIDGDCPVAQRQATVQAFQDGDTPVLLLTSQVGGLGLTLTAATRVLILDPSWNPARDDQCVDRACRIGQTRRVVVYRLVTVGTVEEKIYRRQVYKGGLARVTMHSGANPHKYFSRTELKDLFTTSPEELRHSCTAALLGGAGGTAGLVVPPDPPISAHLERLRQLPFCEAVSDHAAVFSTQQPPGATPEAPAARLQPEGPPDSPTGTEEARGALEEPQVLSDVTEAGPQRALQPTEAAAARPLSSIAASDAALGKVLRALENTLAALTVSEHGDLLPDGGAKLHARRQQLEAQLAASQPGSPGGSEQVQPPAA